MPTPDMRPYAERLAKAINLPFREGDGLAWWVESPEQLLCHANMTEAEQWACWGPLADELKVKSVSVGTFDGDCHFVGPTDLLEAIAEAVCQEAERRGK